MDVFDAILDGYDPESFKRLIQFYFQDEYDKIDWSGDMSAIASSTVALAHQRGWIDGLIGAMKTDNPKNPLIGELLNGESNAVEVMSDNTKLAQIHIVLFGYPDAHHPGFIEKTDRKLEDIDKRLRGVTRAFIGLTVLSIAVNLILIFSLYPWG